MNPVDPPSDPRGDRIRDLDQFRGILRLYKVLVPSIAITEVVAQFDIFWNAMTKLYKLFDHHLLRVFESTGHRIL